MTPNATLDAWLAVARTQLADIGETPALDARRLAEHVCGLSTAGLILAGRDPLDLSTRRRLDTTLARRLSGESIAHIVGHCGFWCFDLRITGDVLVPRSDTETLVETVLGCLPQDASCHVADLGTGSGAIALALAHERPRWQLMATDASAAALAVARDNAARLGQTGIVFRPGRWFEALPGDIAFDAIVANPPYIAADDPHLAQLTHEPHEALVSGIDGFDDIRHLARHAATHLQPGGLLCLEHGHTQGRTARELLSENDFHAIETRRDLAGRERVTLGKRRL